MRILLGLSIVMTLALSSAAGASAFELRPVARTGQTITVAWDRQPGAVGYLFLRNGVVVARTLDSSMTRATFWKGGSKYSVQVLRRRSDGRVVHAERATVTAADVKSAPRGRRFALTFVPAPRPVEFKLRLVSQRASTVTLAWRRQPGAVGYKFSATARSSPVRGTPR
jgi:hypothetical protein